MCSLTSLLHALRPSSIVVFQPFRNVLCVWLVVSEVQYSLIMVRTSFTSPHLTSGCTPPPPHSPGGFCSNGGKGLRLPHARTPLCSGREFGSLQNKKKYYQKKCFYAHKKVNFVTRVPRFCEASLNANNSFLQNVIPVE